MNSNEYLAPEEYVLYSDNEDVIKISENFNAEKLLLKNNTLYPKEYVVIDCEYDEAGKLLGVQTKASGRIDVVSEKYIYIERRNSNQFKTFLWESFDTMMPLER